MDAPGFGCLMTEGAQITYVLDGQLRQMEGLDGAPQSLGEANLNAYYGSWGLIMDDGVVLAARQLEWGGILVETSSKMMNFGEISTAILTGSDAYDIYVTFLSRPDYNALYRKGYLQPLEDEDIVRWTALVYPKMAKAFTRHGGLCASYPSSVHPDALTSTKTIHNGSRRSN